MIQGLIVFFIPFGVVNADLAESGSAVVDAASKVAAQVDLFSSPQGFSGALHMQSAYPPLSEAVSNLVEALDSAVVDELEASTQSLSGAGKAIGNLLNSLSEKASDIAYIGAGDLFRSNLGSIINPAISIINKVISVAAPRCSIIHSIEPGVSVLSAAYSRVLSVYTVTAAVFPDFTCDGSSRTAPVNSDYNTESNVPFTAVLEVPGPTIIPESSASTDNLPEAETDLEDMGTSITVVSTQVTLKPNSDLQRYQNLDSDFVPPHKTATVIAAPADSPFLIQGGTDAQPRQVNGAVCFSTMFNVVVAFVSSVL